jgi:hypothetical protein
LKHRYPLLLLSTIGLITAAALAYRTPSSSVPERGPVRMIRFVLSDDGLYPRRLQVKQGLLNIALEDKTSRSEGLVIEYWSGDQSARITQIQSSEDNRRGRALLRLTPGRYVVSDASQPSHAAELLVNP